MSEYTPQTAKQGLPALAKSTIWMLSFGFLIQIQVCVPLPRWSARFMPECRRRRIFMKIYV
ncbi:integral membrane transport protein [Neisseria meningitidis]|nr:integral membrane transport protein [Neisseria meningitidis]